MTDFRTKGTIMGPTGLTAVFGMGTGVAPPVWSPGKRPAAMFRTAGRVFGGVGEVCGFGACFIGTVDRQNLYERMSKMRRHDSRFDEVLRMEGLSDRLFRELGGRVGVVKPLGC